MCYMHFNFAVTYSDESEDIVLIFGNSRGSRKEIRLVHFTLIWQGKEGMRL